MSDGQRSCPRCGGTGKVYDARVIGAKMRAKRLKRKISLRTMAGVMGYSASYICDLELGRREWSGALLGHYAEALLT